MPIASQFYSLSSVGTNVTEDTPRSERPMLGALLAEIATLIGRIARVKKGHLIAVSHHAGEKARWGAPTQLRK